VFLEKNSFSVKVQYTRPDRKDPTDLGSATRAYTSTTFISLAPVDVFLEKTLLVSKSSIHDPDRKNPTDLVSATRGALVLHS